MGEGLLNEYSIFYDFSELDQTVPPNRIGRDRGRDLADINDTTSLGPSPTKLPEPCQPFTPTAIPEITAYFAGSFEDHNQNGAISNKYQEKDLHTVFRKKDLTA